MNANLPVKGGINVGRYDCVKTRARGEAICDTTNLGPGTDIAAQMTSRTNREAGEDEPSVAGERRNIGALRESESSKDRSRGRPPTERRRLGRGRSHIHSARWSR